MTQKIYTNKYQNVSSDNMVSIAIALCEKAITLISNAQKDPLVWSRNLNIVHQITDLMIAMTDTVPESSDISPVREFYVKLAAHTNALITEKLDSSKAQDLVQAFIINRDTWKDIEKQVLATSDNSNLATI